MVKVSVKYDNDYSVFDGVFTTDHIYKHLEITNSFYEIALLEKVKSLPHYLRSVFVLYEIQGFKYKEISKSLDIPINSVKVYLLRARKKLQEELKSYELQEAI
jgi:DNA-directed RNA polymerase specialized sigma24 family protein